MKADTTMERGTQARLAKKADISPQHLNDCLAGRRSASGLKALALAEITATRPDLWMGRRGEDVPPKTIKARRKAVLNWKG